MRMFALVGFVLLLVVLICETDLCLDRWWDWDWDWDGFDLYGCGKARWLDGWCLV